MAISNALVVFLCIIGAAAGIMIAWAVASPYYRRARSDEEAGLTNGNQSQWTYMMEVRQRNREAILANLGGRHVYQPPTPGPAMTASSGF